jgi:hypothetical protein
MKNEPAGTKENPPGAGVFPAVRRRSHRPRRKWILLAGFAVVLVGTGLGARPAWRMVKAIRAAGFLNESETSMHAEQWTRAFERLRLAQQLSPTDPRVLRHAAHLHGRFSPDLALYYFEQLSASPAATREDFEGYAAAALAAGDNDLAGMLLDDLLQGTNTSTRSHLLASQYYALHRNSPEALRHARECVRGEPGNVTNVLALATLLSISPHAADRGEALSLLWPHARNKGPFQLRAMEAILRAPGTPRADREAVQSMLSELPERTIAEELLLLDARVSLDPSSRMEAVAEIIERFGHDNGNALISAAQWLNRHGFFDQTLELLPPDTARTGARLTRLRYDALMGRHDPQGAYAWIAATGLPGDALQTEFLRCAAAQRCGNDAALEAHLNNLVSMSRRQPRQLRLIAEFARRHGKPQVAAEAHMLLSRHPREAARAFTALLRSADAAGDTWLARDFARKLARLRTQDQELQLQIAYYDLLLEENLEEAMTTAMTLHEAAPDDFKRRAVLALAYLRRQEPGKAAEIVHGHAVPWTRLAPGIRAVVIAALGANGRDEVAGRLLDHVPLARLKPEERALIRPSLSGAGMGVETAETEEVVDL